MKYYIVQNEAQRQTTNFDIIKVKETVEGKFLEGLKEDTKVVVEADSLMEAIIKFQKAIAND
ncbi:hypothetical protein QEG73_12795 [Chitinophagaceae bacterium 26-R-25]|nr:hypothetical protein [Chitinophagaceae bacterium 26-R-25]